MEVKRWAKVSIAVEAKNIGLENGKLLREWVESLFEKTLGARVSDTDVYKTVTRIWTFPYMLHTPPEATALFVLDSIKQCLPKDYHKVTVDVMVYSHYFQPVKGT